MDNSLINQHLLKPETVDAVHRAGLRVTQVVDRWLGGWPKQTRKLEADGTLIEKAREQVEIEEPARHYASHHPDVGMNEALEMYDVTLSPPA